MPTSNGTDEESSTRLAPLGRGLLFTGILLVVARGLPFTTRMSGLPSFWYTNQATWVAAGFGLTGFGWWILWQMPRLPVHNWRPSVSGPRFDTALLYVSEGCHLCDDAAELLSQYRRWLPPFQEVDIRTDPVLVERFGKCVPVVAFDGKVRFRGRINEELLRRLIEGTAPKKSF